MDWERVSNEDVDMAIDHFAGLTSAGLAPVYELIGVVDVHRHS